MTPQISAMLMEMNVLEADGTSALSLSLSPTDAPLLDAVCPLLRLLDTPSDAPMLAPLGRA